jgi:hypothetical protein
MEIPALSHRSINRIQLSAKQTIDCSNGGFIRQRGLPFSKRVNVSHGLATVHGNGRGRLAKRALPWAAAVSRARSWERQELVNITSRLRGIGYQIRCWHTLCFIASQNINE